ncbi:MAG: family 43 glycosylhydrolase [Bacteroidota bacterium]
MERLKESKMYFFKSYLVAAISILMLVSCGKDKNGNEEPDNTDTIQPVAEGHYRNPITVELEDDAIGGEGIADPSVFRWMGKYYLMTTQYYKNIGYDGFKVWESDNLVDWNYKRTIDVQGFVWDVLWAPEMYYYRGDFYIYLSGPGGKMAVWKYDVPQNVVNPEPFGDEAVWTAVTHDFLQLSDHSIDGSILIEPNGDKYAFFSGLLGVKYRMINSMDDGNGGPVTQLGQCSVNNINIQPGSVGTVGWTESPTTFKYNGKYYLTYTGNHYLRPDYQIHLAVGNSLDDLTPISDNPWISQTYGDWTGTGNCYPILGPNLKDYYYSYHAKEGGRISGAEGIHRKLMIDKVEFTAETIETDAPTFDDRKIPGAADFEVDFSNDISGFTIEGDASWNARAGFAVRADASDLSRLISDVSTQDNFIAEANMKIVDVKSEASRVGFVHGNNLIVGLEYSDSTNRIFIYDTKDNYTFYNLPDDFKVTEWIDLRIIKSGLELKVFVNNVEVINKLVDNFTGDKIGYMAENCIADVAWLAFSNQ